MTANDEGRPMLQVVRGTPDDAELAALTAVLSAAAGSAPGDDGPGRRSTWADVGPRLRQPLRPGPGAWQLSGRPR